MSNIELECFSCGTKNSYLAPLGRREECTKCHADAHCCKNCAHYDEKVYNSCKEPQADVVKERDRANFCDYFSPRSASGAGAKVVDLKAQAESLFKK